LGELFKELVEAKAKYGITTVQPSRATKKCRIRNLRIEYFLAKIAVVIAVPRACRKCPKQDSCGDDFVKQIIQKYNERHEGSEDDLFF
jgi:hypothetical protein